MGPYSDARPSIDTYEGAQTMPPTTRSRARTRTPVTPESLESLVMLGGPAISPDGNRIAFVHKKIGNKNNYVTNIWMMNADRGEPFQFTAGDRDGTPIWSPDGKSLAFIGGRQKGAPQVYVIPADGGEARAVTELPEGSVYQLKWSSDSRTLAFCFRAQAEDMTESASKDRTESGGTTPPLVTEEIFYRLDGDGYFGERRFKLFVVDLETNKHRMVYGKDSLGFLDYDWAPDGRRMVIATNRSKRAFHQPEKAELLILDVNTGKSTPIPDLPKGPKSNPIWSPNGRHIAYAGRDGKDGTYSTENLGLWVCDARHGRAQCLTEKTDWCLLAATLSDTSEASFEPWIAWSGNDRVLARIGWHGEAHVARFNRNGSGKPRMLTLGRVVVSPGNLSADGRRMAMTVDQPTGPAEIHLGRLNANSIAMKKRTHFNDEFVKSHSIAKPTTHWIRSEDGTRVQAWVLRPTTGRGKRHPGILEIHGGPHAQYGWGFFHEFQVLANAGYVVVYSNPRGSKGYGRDFCHAIRGTWGTVDWEDIHAVAKWMTSRDFIDSKRIGVMGGSYGGYMTNWAIGSTDMFTAAISDRCVSNLVSMAGNSDFPLEPNKYWPGNAWDSPEGLWASSPIRLMGQARTPTLVIHSEGDLRCNIEQGEQVFSALKQQNVPARLVRYPRETSHGMSRSGPPDMRLHRLHEILDWWKRWFSGKKKS